MNQVRNEPSHDPQTPSRRDVLRDVALGAAGIVMPGCAGLWPHTTVVEVPSRAPALPGGLEVQGTRFLRGGSPFVVNGMNYWAALPLSREGNSAGWDQVRRDLDAMQALGVNMLRIVGATEGPDSAPYRIVPTLQPHQGQFDSASLNGLARFIAELETRGLIAIVMLNNFWHWSGGMAQYLEWAGEGPIPYPPPHPGGSWSTYQRYTTRFYANEKANLAFAELLRFIVPPFKSSPSVIWELANEPRGITSGRAFASWIHNTAGRIRSLAPHHLITTGSEGQTATAFFSGTDLVRDHQSPHIDFATFHLWAENWGWVRGDDLPGTFSSGLEKAKAYVLDHVDRARQMGKPLLLEEFGFPRDNGSFAPSAATTYRDRYFESLYELVGAHVTNGEMVGLMPWAWAGQARPRQAGALWLSGDPLIGDPPHERQGWYSLYDRDTTLAIVRRFADRHVNGNVPPPTAARS